MGKAAVDENGTLGDESVVEIPVSGEDELETILTPGQEEEIGPEPEAPVGFEDNKVVVGDREFVIEEPTIDITLRILNVIGAMGLRGERVAVAQLARDPTGRATLFGLLAVMAPPDLERLGSAVLQFEDDRDGRKFMKELTERGELKVAPLMKAFFLCWSQSTDLQEALRNFYYGLAILGALMGSVPKLSGIL